MAELCVDGDELVLHMSGPEKAEGFHGDIGLPRRAERGVRAPGTGLPHVVAVGTRRGGFGKDSAAVHAAGPAVGVDPKGAEYGRFAVTVDDALGRVGQIRHALPHT